MCLCFMCVEEKTKTHTHKSGVGIKSLSLPPSPSLPARLPAVFKITLIKITVNNYKPRVDYLVLI